MTIQAWLIFTAAQDTAARALNNSSARVEPKLINNALADNLGEGVLVGKRVAPARLLNDPLYQPWYASCSTLPIRTLDSDTLFMPDPEP